VVLAAVWTLIGVVITGGIAFFALLKSDIGGLRGEMIGLRGEMNGLRGEMNGLRAEMNQRFDTVHLEIRQVGDVQTNLITRVADLERQGGTA
jgi:hypothetical protein